MSETTSSKITDQDVLKAVKVLSEYCEGFTSCSGCVLDGHGIDGLDCALQIYPPNEVKVQEKVVYELVK